MAGGPIRVQRFGLPDGRLVSYHHWRHHPADEAAPTKPFGKMNKTELIALAAELDIQLTGDETKAELQGRIADASDHE